MAVGRVLPLTEQYATSHTWRQQYVTSYTWRQPAIRDDSVSNVTTACQTTAKPHHARKSADMPSRGFSRDRANIEPNVSGNEASHQTASCAGSDSKRESSAALFAQGNETIPDGRDNNQPTCLWALLPCRTGSRERRDGGRRTRTVGGKHEVNGFDN